MTQIRWGGNECTPHNFSLFVIFLPKVIKIGENLRKFSENNFAQFLDTVYRAPVQEMFMVSEIHPCKGRNSKFPFTHFHVTQSVGMFFYEYLDAQN